MSENKKSYFGNGIDLGAYFGEVVGAIFDFIKNRKINKKALVLDKKLVRN